MFNAKGFYPTPDYVINEMLSNIGFGSISTILEPSAGKGSIVDKIKERDGRIWRHNDLDIDVIEINENLQHILKGKGYRLIHDDFLTFNTHKQYDLIIMNPPFSDGDKHLLKALDMQRRGGEIVCLLNAETIKNPYTNTRRDLVKKLQHLNANIEYLASAFTNAERKTDVEIAVIKINIPCSNKSSVLLDELKKEEVYTTQEKVQKDIVNGDYLKRIVEQYNFEIRAGLKLINEYFAMQPLIKRSLKDDFNPPIIELAVGKEKDSMKIMSNQFIKKVRYKYWEALLQSDMFAQIFTQSLQYQYMEKITELQGYDFSLYNIQQIKVDISKVMMQSIEDTILELFDEFSHKHYWSETSTNIHYYDGWKTNNAWKINKKVIIPLSAYGDYRFNERLDYMYTPFKKLKDIEKVFNYLDGGLTKDHKSMKETLQHAQDIYQTKRIQLKYFNVTFYKKGTCHIEFSNLTLLKKFNIFGSQRKGWLPPSYGKTSYNEMSKEEQKVVDEFEGKAAYQEVMEKKDYYIYSSNDALLLA